MVARRKNPLRKRAKKTRAPKSTVSVAVKKYVNRALHTTIENKSVQINYGLSFGNVLESPDMNAFPMLPLSGFWTIPQGTGAGGRIGNQIKTRKCYLNYVLRPNVYDALFNAVPRPTEVQLMLGYVKNTPSFVPAALDINQLFQAGSSVAAPVGSLRDIVSVINTDYWVIKKRWTHKIGFAQASGTGASAGAQYYSNNDFKYNVVKRLDITKMVPTTVQFNDGGLTPTSKNLFLMYQSVNADGGVFGATVLPTNIEFWIDYHYEDA